ncbi:MAG: class I SAM-dependent methyltransferase, partial [Gemmatimonadales bacterium]|nr:class I SAM-dependent methyltransferase [Gemmatimonadales bacterium]
RELRRRYFPEDAGWEVRQGSALDAGFVRGLGQFDVVYSWGVLHHTGAMWDAIHIAQQAVAPGGEFFIAIYNDQGAWSHRWKRIKRFYCSGPVGKWLVLGTFVPWWLLRGFIADVVWGRNPFAPYLEYRKGRGMSVVHDWKDWLGGYPFEVAKPEEIVDDFQARGFRLRTMRTQRGMEGCNEFVFQLERPAGA